MKARIAMCLAITLNDEDKQILINQKTLECSLFDFEKQKVYLKVFLRFICQDKKISQKFGTVVDI